MQWQRIIYSRLCRGGFYFFMFFQQLQLYPLLNLLKPPAPAQPAPPAPRPRKDTGRTRGMPQEEDQQEGALECGPQGYHHPHICGPRGDLHCTALSLQGREGQHVAVRKPLPQLQGLGWEGVTGVSSSV